MSQPPHGSELGDLLAHARADAGLSLRDVERRSGIRSGHLSQIETGRIVKPEMAILWELAGLYDVDFRGLLTAAGYLQGDEGAGEKRHRMTVAMRALGELTADEQAEALLFMADLKARRGER